MNQITAAALSTFLLLATGDGAFAQHRAADAPAGHARSERQPYAGLQQRPIKALFEKQIADLEAGRGMGLALAAELNGYPGPTHVLELASDLELSDLQVFRTGELRERMTVEAVAIGARIIELEAELDRAFADRTITEEGLQAASMRIAVVQGELRATHLRYHLDVAKLLSVDQITRYANLRGYGSSE